MQDPGIVRGRSTIAGDGAAHQVHHQLLWLKAQPQVTAFAEGHAANADTPVFMAHGSHDPVVRMERGLASRDALLALGQPVQWHSYPMEHSLCAQEVADISAFLQRVLPS